jgi:hypothetical protein
MNPEKEIGNRYGRLVITAIIPPSETTNKRTHCLCDCDCGNTGVEKDMIALTSGRTLSCGCKREENKQLATVRLDITAKSNERRRFLSLTSPGEYKKYLVY